MKKNVILSIILQLSFLNIFAQNLVLREKIDQIIKSKNATVGVGIMNFEDGDTLCLMEKDIFRCKVCTNFIWRWQF